MLQASEGANKGQRNSVDNKGRKFRRLKVCDRVIPCKNCVNRKTSELCSYSPEAQANAVTQTVEISNLPLWDATKKAIALVKILPERKDIHKCIQVFNDNIQSFGLPLQSGDNLGKDIALFLSDLEVNAEKCPSMLAFIFVILSQGTWLLQSLEQATPKQSTHRKGGRESDVYLSAAMHSLTLSSYLNRPTLLALETLILINVYLINTGRFLDAYSLFGSITKLAQMIGWLPGGLPEQGWKSLRNFSSPLFKDAQNGQLPFPQSWGGERVLGGHGMILLEDPGLMDHNPSSDTFNPLDWSDLLVDDDGTGVKDWHGETSAEPSFEITADVTPADFPKGLFVRDIPVRSASSSTQSELGDDPETSKRSREQPSLSPKPSCFTTTCKRRKTEGEDMLPPEKPSAGLTHASTKKSGHTAFAIAGSAELTKQIFAKGLAPIVGGTSHEVRENFADSSIPATLDHTRTSEVRPLPFDPSQSKGLTPLHSASVKARNELEGLARVNFNASLPMTESLSEPVDYPATSVPMTQSFSEPILQRHTAIPYTPESEVPMCKPQLTLPHQQANTLCHPLQSEEQSLGRERVLNHRDSYFTSYFTPLPTPTIPGPLLIHSKAAPPQTSQVLYPLDTNTAMDQMSYFSSQPLFASTAVAASVPNLNATGNADTMDQLTTNTYNHNVSAIDSIAGQPLSPIPPDPMNLDRHEDHILPSNHMVDMDLATMMPEAGIQPNLLQTPPGQVRWVSTSMGV
ncbi:putative zn 2cys6 transcription factor [Phaeomoniella chlamydospora]|uniref:Putative zn 2cys6 transcription factor n=1 Tax=Phaeomoniella chlamydospora TaxID=158046 RepID=A0A0G2E4V0_PHACM|nr:putative zn 2cys6 transcription factor [Phaeomoniella chlamydospora]